MDTIGEKLFDKFLEQKSSLKLISISRKKGCKTSDFFVKFNNLDVAVCEIKDIEDERHNYIHETLESLSIANERRKKIEYYENKIIASGLTKDERKELNELGKEEKNELKIMDEHSDLLHKRFRSAIENKTLKATEQLSNYELPKILTFVVFNMANFIDLMKYLQEPQNGPLNNLDLIVWLEIHEPIKRNGNFNIKRIYTKSFSENGDSLYEKYFSFLKSLADKLPFCIHLDL